MDSRFLESFLTVVDCGSFAEAARRLNLTAAGVAQRIHVLEQEFGTRLIVRSGRACGPPRPGVQFLAMRMSFSDAYVI